MLGQVATNVIVAVACGTKIVTSSLDLPETLSAAIEAFFILEIDDALLPFLTFIVQPKGHELREKENLSRFDEKARSTCLECTKKGIKKDDKCEYVVSIIFIITSYLVMLIAPVIITMNNTW